MLYVKSSNFILFDGSEDMLDAWRIKYFYLNLLLHSSIKGDFEAISCS